MPDVETSSESVSGLPSWTFEPGHTEAGFRVRHMMVTWVQGLFKDVHGKLYLDWDDR
jgi:polyisoprenoid-binding protein YceI